MRLCDGTKQDLLPGSLHQVKKEEITARIYHGASPLLASKPWKEPLFFLQRFAWLWIVKKNEERDLESRGPITEASNEEVPHRGNGSHWARRADRQACLAFFQHWGVFVSECESMSWVTSLWNMQVAQTKASHFDMLDWASSRMPRGSGLPATAGAWKSRLRSLGWEGAEKRGKERGGIPWEMLEVRLQ